MSCSRTAALRLLSFKLQIFLVANNTLIIINVLTKLRDHMLSLHLNSNILPLRLKIVNSVNAL